MSNDPRPAAPRGDLQTFTREHFASDGFAHDLYRKGSGPAVIVLAEMPGIAPQLLGFADRVAALGCTAVLPDLFGTAGRDPLAADGRWYALQSLVHVCISREFTLFATGRSSPVVRYLRSLAAREHARCGGPGVGVIGMCFTGGFALAMAADEHVIAPVVSQPSLPLPISASRRRSIDCAPDELDRIAGRCQREGLRVLGLRFQGDDISTAERFEFLKQRLGDGFVAIELSQADRHPKGPLPKAHSVLTGDFVDAPGEPTHNALERVLELWKSKLLGERPARAAT